MMQQMIRVASRATVASRRFAAGVVSGRRGMATFYTQDHEYIRVEGKIGVVGITDFAQNKLGDIVFAELPSVGKKLEKARAWLCENSSQSFVVCTPRCLPVRQSSFGLHCRGATLIDLARGLAGVAIDDGWRRLVFWRGGRARSAPRWSPSRRRPRCTPP
jgi:hypothetical protein